MGENNFIPAVEKTILLLERLGDAAEHGMSQSELSGELQITPSSCYRILQTLLNADWVRKSDGGKFFVSGGIMNAARHIAEYNNRFMHCQSSLDQLAATVELSCKLSVRRGNEQLTLMRGESPRSISVSGKIGAHFPVMEGSVGAALLADTAPEEITALCGRCREDIPEKSDTGLIFSRIGQLRQQGYCVNMRPNRWNVRTMSMPVRDAENGIIAALTLIGFAEDFAEDKISFLAEKLQETTGRIK